MSRTKVLTRYRRLRQISKEHHHAVLSIIAPDVLLDWAKRLGLTEGKKVLLENEHEMTLAEDLATYLPRPGRSHPLDRYARAAQLQACYPDETASLPMQRAHTSTKTGRASQTISILASRNELISISRSSRR